MTKRTLSNKGRYSVLKVSGFRARMETPQGRNIIKFYIFSFFDRIQTKIFESERF